MSQWWKKTNRRKNRTPARRRPKLMRPGLSMLTLEDRTVPTVFTQFDPHPDPDGSGHWRRARRPLDHRRHGIDRRHHASGRHLQQPVARFGR